MAYGDKRNHRKIDIFVDGSYVGTTTWSRTCREAKQKFLEKHPDTDPNSVRTRFQVQ